MVWAVVGRKEVEMGVEEWERCGRVVVSEEGRRGVVRVSEMVKNWKEEETRKGFEGSQKTRFDSEMKMCMFYSKKEDTDWFY